MKKLRVTALALCLSVALCVVSPCVLAEDEGAPKLNSAQSALIGDLSSGRILYNVDAYSRRYPASLTKIMTLLLAVEAVEQGTASLEDKVTAGSDSQSGLTECSSSSGICIGETMSMKDLLYCAALASANEACNIIAGHVAGSISAFVEKMNARAAGLGCSGTHFVNTHGMHDSEHYTTAHDMFLIAREGMRHALFAQLVGTREYTTSATNVSSPRTLRNSNALINSDSPYSDKYFYTGAVGIKTGYTSDAGYCLASAVQRESVSVITVVLGADGGSGSYDSFADTVTLLDWFFENYSYHSIVEKGFAAASQPLSVKGKSGSVTLVCAQGISALAANDLDVSALEKTVTLKAETLDAVPAEGTELGTVSFSDPTDGTELGTVALVASNDVQLDEPEPQPAAPQELSHEQKLTIVIVCAITVLLLLVFILLLVRRQKRMNNKQ